MDKASQDFLEQEQRENQLETYRQLRRKKFEQKKE